MFGATRYGMVFPLAARRDKPRGDVSGLSPRPQGGASAGQQSGLASRDEALPACGEVIRLGFIEAPHYVRSDRMWDGLPLLAARRDKPRGARGDHRSIYLPSIIMVVIFVMMVLVFVIGIVAPVRKVTIDTGQLL